MTLRQLLYLIRALDEGSISAAAVALNVAQSAVSRQIALLEAELGTALIRRGGRGIEATAAGQVVEREARTILARVDALPGLVERAPGSAGISVGASASFGGFLFSRLARREHGESIRWRFVQAATRDLLAAVDSGDLDIAVIAHLPGQPASGSGYHVVDLCREAVYLVGRRDLLPPAEPVPLAEALALPLIMMPAGSLERQGYVGIAQGLGAALNVVADAPELDLKYALARGGVGFVMIPVSGLEPLRESGTLDARRVDTLELERCLIMRPSFADHPACRQAQRAIRRIVSADGPAQGIHSIP
ncbi:MAG: LysR family transcriptional regulator [Rhodobacteraceae bacterium]|nr:LysR family transcriptional regulator [Paracoccaceae bacterium]